MENYKTKDIYEGSALIAAKARFLFLEPEGSFYWFVFEDTLACRNISDQYWRNELTVKAKDYAEAIKTLKDRIFANR
jgi:hypothetical protein